MSQIANVMVVGDAGCGKTSLLNVFSTNRRIDEHTPLEFKSEVICVMVNGERVPLLLCNTSGEKSRKLARFNTGHV